MVVVITGTSDGIGFETARLFASKGWTVYGISKSKANASFMEELIADVTDHDLLQAATEKILEKEKQIDLLILCAGITMAAPGDQLPMQTAKHIYDVNLWGCINTIQHFTPIMRKNKQGQIVLISSVTGILPLPYLNIYGSSKAALISYGSSLALELKPDHISVSVVVPGGVKTRFTEKRILSSVKDIATQKRTLKSAKRLGMIEQRGMKPETVARKILSLSEKKYPPAVVTVHRPYQLLCFFLRLLPQRLILFLTYRFFQ